MDTTEPPTVTLKKTSLLPLLRPLVKDLPYAMLSALPVHLFGRILESVSVRDLIEQRHIYAPLFAQHYPHGSRSGPANPNTATLASLWPIATYAEYTSMRAADVLLRMTPGSLTDEFGHVLLPLVTRIVGSLHLKHTPDELCHTLIARLLPSTQLERCGATSTECVRVMLGDAFQHMATLLVLAKDNVLHDPMEDLKRVLMITHPELLLYARHSRFSNGTRSPDFNWVALGVTRACLQGMARTYGSFAYYPQATTNDIHYKPEGFPYQCTDCSNLQSDVVFISPHHRVIRVHPGAKDDQHDTFDVPVSPLLDHTAWIPDYQSRLLCRRSCMRSVTVHDLLSSCKILPKDQIVANITNPSEILSSLHYVETTGKSYCPIETEMIVFHATTSPRCLRAPRALLIDEPLWWRRFPNNALEPVQDVKRLPMYLKYDVADQSGSFGLVTPRLYNTAVSEVVIQSAKNSNIDALLPFLKRLLQMRMACLMDLLLVIPITSKTRRIFGKMDLVPYRQFLLCIRTLITPTIVEMGAPDTTEARAVVVRAADAIVKDFFDPHGGTYCIGAVDGAGTSFLNVAIYSPLFLWYTLDGKRRYPMSTRVGL